MFWRKKRPESGPAPEQAVLVHIKLTGDEFGEIEERQRAYDLEDRMIEAIDKSGAGKLDGHEFGGGWCVFYVYGRDANILAEVVLTVLRRESQPAGSHLVKRFGEPGAPQEQIDL